MKVAIVTGASRGIGASVAEGLAADGYWVALVSRTQESLEKVAERISQSSSQKVSPPGVYPLDVSDTQAVADMVSSVAAAFGRIDILFNNAGIAPGRFVTLDLPVEEFDRLLSINLRGPFNCLKAVVPYMKKQGSGTIINVASRAGKVGFAGVGAYGASKFGLVGLSESLYRELSPLGIKVTSLCPSWVDTDMARNSGLPAEEMIQPDDILQTVRWLLTLHPASVVKEIIIECRKQIA